jgi:dienelactone hydrolase
MSNVKQRREELYGLMGDLPGRDRKISVRKISEEEREGYGLEKLVLDLNGIEEVPAYFVSPLSRKAAKVPVVLYNHAHGGDYPLGKDELLKSRKLLCPKPYANELTEMGFAALCIDTWAFGERATRKETEIFKDMLWHGQVMWGMMVYDTLRALDYLASREDVDSSRIATLGLSMGSTMAWWASALDERIKVCVDICCLTDYQALIDHKSLDAHGVYYYVPSLMKHFTAGQINALIAPRPHLGLAGNLDRLTPTDGLDRIDAELKNVYAEMGHPEAWKLFRQDVPHQETPEMRAEIVAFLKRWL